MNFFRQAEVREPIVLVTLQINQRGKTAKKKKIDQAKSSPSKGRSDLKYAKTQDIRKLKDSQFLRL